MFQKTLSFKVLLDLHLINVSNRFFLAMKGFNCKALEFSLRLYFFVVSSVGNLHDDVRLNSSSEFQERTADVLQQNLILGKPQRSHKKIKKNISFRIFSHEIPQRVLKMSNS